jgi:phenylacetate-CoA ligase
MVVVMSFPRYWNEKIETMPDRELKELQERKLRAQLKYVYDRCSFYRQRFKEHNIHPDDIKNIEDLRKLPFITKEDERRLQDKTRRGMELGEHQIVPTDQIVRVHSTSGTTGRPVYFGFTRHDLEVWTEGIARCFYCAGVRPGDVVMYGWGLEMFVGGIPVIDALRKIGCATVPAGARTPSERFLRIALDLHANVFGCTPSYALYLLDVARQKLGVEPQEIGFKKYFAGAEPGTQEPGIRKRLKEEWGLESACDTLGIGEVMTVVAAECQYEHGMHYLIPDFAIFELIDPKTDEPIEITEGAEGEPVYTIIDREATPLIRYRSRDHAKVWTEPCECGRKRFRLRCIGRVDDMLICKGVNVFPTAVRDIVSTFAPKVTGHIQVLLEKPGPRVDGPLRVQVEYGPNVKGEDLEKLRMEIEDKIRDILLVKADVELVPPNTLPRFTYKASLIRKLYEEKGK